MASPTKSPLYERLIPFWMFGCGMLGAGIRDQAWRDRVSNIGLGIVIVFGVLIGILMVFNRRSRPAEPRGQ